MATASLRTLSPNNKAYRSTSTFNSLKMASIVTEKHAKYKKKKHVKVRDNHAQTALRTTEQNLASINIHACKIKFLPILSIM